MNILILSKGEDHEGGSVRGVFADTPEGIAMARADAEALIEDCSFDWTECFPTYEPLIADWNGGCDWITLVRHPVREHPERF